MSTMARIRRLISSIQLGELFTTRNCLSFGSRGSVDQSLYSLVKSGTIVRVVRGVFMRPGSDMPTALQLAKIKAESFGKRIYQHGADSAHAIGFPVNQNRDPTFATNGRSSSFRFGETLIRMIGTSPRKLIEPDPHSGQVIRAMWHAGKNVCSDDLVSRTYHRWGRACRQLEETASLLPAWMNELFYWGRTERKSRKLRFGSTTMLQDLLNLMPELAQYLDPAES